MRRWAGILFIICAATGTAGTSPAVAVPVGMACHLTGKPEVGTGGKWKPLRLMQRLQAGDTVRCSAGAEAIIQPSKMAVSSLVVRMLTRT